ncbi:dienelactone hydrolase family protein [Azospirillum sp. TSO22-1]|uniref:dienelactone hydrolase family protein n=1 Tax=Azospirillum sp. TSO22-1 TaxID=716789 RepID=UPI000D6175B4|nr:dienelactone hydrolase family protein [Azospirillum sp. TSO22-1]PWC55848.1 carboxymethylenebutenolidase [Azospirillum sp. TSO22-1]
MDQTIIDLYDEYTHAPLPRRVFLERLTALLGSAAAVPAVLAAIEPNYARAAVVEPGDPRISVENVTFQGATGDVRGYLARPKTAERAPAVIVIHENRGLNPHIEDVARRFAADGFVALAVDLLSPLGGTPADADRARDMIAQLDAGKTVNNLVSAQSFLMSYRYSSGKVGAVGFCWGGGMVNQFAIKAPDLKAAVAYYGPTPDPAQVGSIKAPMLLHYGGLDQRINAGIPAYEEALKKAGVPHQIYVYEGANHAFNNDTSADRYNEQVARLAWGRTVEFLRQYLV